jgi:hypothetical protein
MESFKEYLLLEKVTNLFLSDKEGREKWADQVWNILRSSYKSIGGIHGSGFKSKEDMIAKIPLWKIFRRGDVVQAVMMYKDKNGRKRVAIGTNGEKEGKRMLAKGLIDEYKTGRAFGEVSDASLAFIKKLLGDAINDVAVPVEVVKRLLPDDHIEPVDKYQYLRDIHGHMHKKMMLGNPNASNIKNIRPETF